ncbi:MAG: Glycosyl transferase family 2 [Candidatus Woesebacteria bacterium GW2011_GWA1_43_12]|nr:MAG: Glycosyl transferase family 2 [Candidatus Woesebacteria bacterium GW2011_GWA1_43_12]
MSVIKYVDRAHIWDTGSTDGTIEIIENIMKLNENIDFKKLSVNKFDEAKIRDEMLQKDDCDWVIIVDADEVWWDDSIKQVVDTINSSGDNIESIVVPTYNLVGDIFHYQEKKAGRYNLASKVGHYALRAFNRHIPGLTTKGKHGIFGWFDAEGKRIEKRNQSKMIFVEAPYLHATHLRRSDKNQDVYKRSKKLKYEIGDEFPKDFYFPEVFFKDRPKIVTSVWNTPDLKYKFRAFIETPLRKIYRRTLLRFQKHGY